MEATTLSKAGRKTLSPIGLDIGQTGARAVQLRRSGDGWSLAAAQHWPLRRTEDRAGGVAGLEDRLGRALRQKDFAGRAIVVGLSQPDLELHALELAETPDSQGKQDQLDSAARWEIERLSRFEDRAIEAAHWRLPQGRGTRTSALGVAAPKETISGIWELCRKAGGDCRRIDALPCALSRAGAVLRPAESHEVWGVLDLGARAVRLVLCVNGIPVVARSLHSGGAEWTEKIAELLKVSPESAELHKCDHGIRTGTTQPRGSGPPAAGVSPQPPGEDGPLAELAGMIFAALSSDLDRVTREVERSYEYVLQCYPGRKAADLILAGGSAALRNLDTYLADRLGIPVLRAEKYAEQSGSLLRVDGAASQLRPAAGGLAACLGAVGLAIDPESGP